ncbi:MAG: hypothetical protein ABI721_02915 [Candidatus Dojkabacteria bacterium]
MKTINKSFIIKIFTTSILVLVGVILINVSLNSSGNSLVQTSGDKPIYGPVKLSSIENSNTSEPPCDGQWIDSSATGKIDLNSLLLSDWGSKSVPSLILDTYYDSSKNFLIIGHNICVYGLCDQPRSQFANIMNLQAGDKMTSCLGGILYSGYIFTSGPIPDTRIEVMGNWTGFDTITMFTSYGKCKDSVCSSTEQRWMVAFERDK